MLLSLSCFLFITFHLSSKLVQNLFFLVHNVSVSKVNSDNEGISYGFASICSLNILSQKDFEVPILLNQVIPIELKNSVKFGNPRPPVSFGEKINFCGKMLLLPPFTKFTKNFSISLSSFLVGGGITAARCVNLESKQVLAMLTLPKCEVLIPAHL